MNKKFKHIVPDQPYKQDSKKNITVECEYTGPRYLLCRLNIKSSKVVFVERAGENREFLESTFVDNEPDFDFFILDADVHTWEAAYLTNSYSHGEVPDYEEKLPTGETYTFARKDFDGIISECHAVGELVYNKAQNTFVRPPFVQHPINPINFWEVIDEQVSVLTKRLAGDLSKLSDDQIEKLKAYVAALKVMKTKYNNVDHWKIPCPIYPELPMDTM
jgi:hypothetical protein